MLPSHVIPPSRYCSLSAPMFEEKYCDLAEAANVVTKQGLFTYVESFELFWLNFPCLNTISCLLERPSLVNLLTASLCQPSGARATQIRKLLVSCMSEICVLEALHGEKLIRSPCTFLAYIYHKVIKRLVQHAGIWKTFTMLSLSGFEILLGIINTMHSNQTNSFCG